MTSLEPRTWYLCRSRYANVMITVQLRTIYATGTLTFRIFRHPPLATYVRWTSQYCASTNPHWLRMSCCRRIGWSTYDVYAVGLIHIYDSVCARFTAWNAMEKKKQNGRNGSKRTCKRNSKWRRQPNAFGGHIKRNTIFRWQIFILSVSLGCCSVFAHSHCDCREFLCRQYFIFGGNDTFRKNTNIRVRYMCGQSRATVEITISDSLEIWSVDTFQKIF